MAIKMIPHYEMERIKIASIPIDLFTTKSLNESIKSNILENKNKTPKIYLHANAFLVELANSKEKWLIDFFNQVDHVICDGAGIQLAARLSKKKIPQKIPFNTWIWALAAFMSENNLSLFLLGSDKKTIEKSKKNLLAKNDKLIIKGVHHGYFEKSGKENSEVLDLINKSNSDVLIVGFGMPIQEKWVKNNADKLNVKIIITCGGGFDFVSGNKKIAPRALRKFYLEWLFRFFLEPKRLFKRATISNWNFIKILMKSKE